VLKKATEKTDLIREILAEHPLERGLIYCADKEQLREVQEILHELDVVHLKYIGETPAEKRKSALEALASGQVPAIVAIDCLDEGVDVPVVDTAIILASSRNERQFIQRRGRVLRKAPGKEKATLVDAIALPPPSVGRDGKWMLKGELARAKKMAELADNEHRSLLRLKEITERYGVYLTELLDSGDRTTEEDAKTDDLPDDSNSNHAEGTFSETDGRV
jgi:superfamily II DNA or RNA helicase